MAVLPRQRTKSRRQLLVYAPEATIRKDRHDIPASHLGGHRLHDRVRISKQPDLASVLAQISRQRGQLEALVFWHGIRPKDLCHNDLIGES
jgi:hypothetical protein